MIPTKGGGGGVGRGVGGVGGVGVDVGGGDLLFATLWTAALCSPHQLSSTSDSQKRRSQKP